MIICIAAFSVITISALDSSEYQTPPPAEPETEQPNTAAQSEIDPYDKTVYDNEIVNYTDVILPLNDSYADVYLAVVFFNDVKRHSVAFCICSCGKARNLVQC